MGQFYSYLYLELHAEAAHDPEQARSWIHQAVHTFQTDYISDDDMGFLAIVHQKLRGWS